MADITVPATLEKLESVLSFIDVQLQIAGLDKTERTRAMLASEEIYVNISTYAYGKDKGYATVKCTHLPDGNGVEIEFIDSGKPFNPLEKEAPDIALSAEKRAIGGLGIYLTRLIAEEARYCRKNEKNHFTMLLKPQSAECSR